MWVYVFWCFTKGPSVYIIDAGEIWFTETNLLLRWWLWSINWNWKSRLNGGPTTTRSPFCDIDRGGREGGMVRWYLPSYRCEILVEKILCMLKHHFWFSYFACVYWKISAVHNAAHANSSRTCQPIARWLLQRKGKREKNTKYIMKSKLSTTTKPTKMKKKIKKIINEMKATTMSFVSRSSGITDCVESQKLN